MDRRCAMRWMVRGIGAATAASVGAPALVTLISPVIREGHRSHWRPVGPLDEFAIGPIHTVAIDRADGDPPDASLADLGVFIWRRSRDDIVVYSRACTDLSCPVTHEPGSDWFFCPCHGGVFNKEGEPVAGPPAYPLYRYRTRVRSGVLEVDLHSVPPMA